MQRLTYEVELDGQEPFTVQVDHRDIRRFLFETRPGQKFAWAKEQLVVQATWLAWHASRREEKFDGTWEEFDKVCTYVQDVTPEEEEEPRPTKKGRSATS